MNKEEIKRNNIILHEALTKELLNNHSIAALMKLIEMGREIELIYNNKSISITHLDNKILFSFEDSTERFNDIWSVIVQGRTDGDFFIDCWNEMSIKALF
ncbi:hypothetical protein M2475_001838 [Breznakia sp. PF5-3]|uniref:hypothetical protein n=1 Tax=unclassified Breznakia TaxID=2623764 RepID=UPI0024050264|nr:MULTISPECIES: hypothetical protein [unclassified Breznakia]MDF9825383.1 hypothetical protein [Breznakia sp. PM6-1]MDF9836261.1 hypothetical protein [Breznakia sp. PF5-3]MDF9838978.1 hypothetical protein [Breznakia sp. PFB2-8]MDF9860506.1 hypothetical protein [Breznakia sp. PH5-24]